MKKIIVLSAILTGLCNQAGCASVSTPAKPFAQAGENELSRLRFCVRGGLPIEVQFALPDNPVKLHDSFDMHAVDLIASKVDPHIAKLISEAMLDAWKQIAPRKAKWTRQFVQLIENEHNLKISERAAKVMQLEFCGAPDQVGSQIFIEIGEYFYRSVQHRADEAAPQWLKRFGDAGPGNGRRIVMLAVSLRLANIEFDPQDLVSAF
jgi:hypothetical protein